ncbi:MAG: hypothetical protein KKB20_00720 [Proteobacteria bacterium]|nr:hypothetical protein [Pseudomonadota bacterium]
MKDVRRVAFVVRRTEDVFECARSAAGLAVENLEVGLFILDAPIELPEGDAGFLDLLEMIDDLDGLVFSNLAANAEVYDSIRLLSRADAAARLTGYDLVTAF